MFSFIMSVVIKLRLIMLSVANLKSLKMALVGKHFQLRIDLIFQAMGKQSEVVQNFQGKSFGQLYFWQHEHLVEQYSAEWILTDKVDCCSLFLF